MDDQSATSLFWAFLAYTTGALMAECAATTSHKMLSRSDPAAVDAGQFPHLAALGPALAAPHFATEYERGLEMFIASAAGGAR